MVGVFQWVTYYMETTMYMKQCITRIVFACLLISTATVPIRSTDENNSDNWKTFKEGFYHAAGGAVITVALGGTAYILNYYFNPSIKQAIELQKKEIEKKDKEIFQIQASTDAIRGEIGFNITLDIESQRETLQHCIQIKNQCCNSHAPDYDEELCKEAKKTMRLAAQRLNRTLESTNNTKGPR